MKTLYTLIFAVTAGALVGSAQRPILVGHRGSSYGVENSVESFTNGAKLGYEYLETDFKVTGDKQLVCSHDDDISRLGGSSLVIAESTLEELQAVPFTQTRLGTKYTGRLCSAQEYLDVCKEYGVKPLIELKWATGINSNDCSNIPMLIKLVEDNGFRDKCIILTSMKPCLEYIRKNYPDIELQFLTGQYWESNFEWCESLGIDVDIQAGYFDKTTVLRFHDAGLKVNMWTTNTTDGYKQYGDMGCDFITTDYLDPTDLPELNVTMGFVPNTVDYPASTGEVRGNYTSEKLSEAALPAVLEGRSVRKAIYDAGQWIVLSTDAEGEEPQIHRLDATSGQVVSEYSTDGVDPISDIALTADGVLIGCNQATVPQQGFELYFWEDQEADPEMFYSPDAAADMACMQNATIGRQMAISGKFADMKLYLAAQSADSGAWSLAGIWLKNEDEHKCTFAPMAAGEADAWSSDFNLAVTPTSRDCIVIDGHAAEYYLNWTSPGQEAGVNGRLDESALSGRRGGMSFHRRAGKVYAALPQLTPADAYTLRVYDVSAGFDKAVAVTSALHEGMATADFAASAFTADADKIYVHFFTAPAGMATFALDATSTVEEPQDVELELTCDWIFSHSTGNAPANIDGTNAQQGTAAAGYFYINNCAEKKLHIFNETGYLGSIPGGSGWGCARDDAGNIVIRDDKLTGATHSFIIYPTGATPDEYGQPVTFTTDVVLEGQTNFINASGDLLGASGHIYLFPNKQNAVNIITVEKGAVTDCRAYSDLKITGSTAGYVVPQGDDTEDWLYQVRGNGIYSYYGGLSTAVSTASASTTPPARNSTGGFAYFTMLGNKILVHNSGTNYTGGFTLRNLSAGTTDTKQVVTTVDPIGDRGYSEGGNYSTFNWLIPEKVTDSEYAIYQYCPANGIARYTLRDRRSGIESVSADSAAEPSPWRIAVNDGYLTVEGAAVTDLRVSSLSGTTVATAAGPAADLRHLPAGIYLVTVNRSNTQKIRL